MPKKKILLINADQPEECRAVVLHDGKLEEYIAEHSGRELVKGNIYWGVITRVEPAIEAAFVDFGGKKYGFLPFKDVLKESYLPSREKKAKMRIQDVLVRGQKILVQVVKESRDAKGPSLTNAITIPGRFLVLMCSTESTGVSRKIEDESERKKLKEIVSDLGLPDNMGAIIRTAGVGRTKIELQKDFQMLLKIWENINEKISDPEADAPCVLYQGPDMVVRTVRDHFSNDTNEIVVDNLDSYKALKDFMRLVMPRMHNRIKHYQDTKPLFSQYKVEDQIESIFDRRVELPSGGSIIIDVGEAMVSIDVNSGKTTGASELEDTAVRTNLEAAEEVARQLRLRDLGGLIVIDFIDMFQKKNKSQVEKQLKLSCKADKARVNISRISRFGLMEMSRQRMSPPVKEGVFHECETCQGTGHVKTASTLSLGVLRKIQEKLAADNIKTLKVVASSKVVDYLLSHKMKFLLDFEEKHGLSIQFSSKEHLTYREFSYEILERKREDEVKEVRPRETAPAEPKTKSEEPEVRPAEKPERKGRGRRPSSGRSKSSSIGRGRKESTGDEKGTTTTTRRPTSTRRRPRRTSRAGAGERRPNTRTTPPTPVSEGTGEGQAPKPVFSSSDLDNPGNVPGLGKFDIPDSPSDGAKDVQPVENVSRLHEMISRDTSYSAPPKENREKGGEKEESSSELDSGWN